MVVILKHTTRGNIFSPWDVANCIVQGTQQVWDFNFGRDNTQHFWGDPMFLNKGGENLLKTWRGEAPPS
jgi:hypothetical protein